MTKRVLTAVVCCSLLLAGGGLVFVRTAGAAKLPVVGGKRIVADVDGSPITLDELNRFEMMGGSRPASDTAEVLRRLINARLVIDEAGRIGIPDMPEVKKAVDTYARDTLVEELLARKASAAKPSKEEIERIYARETTKWRIDSVLFAKESDAKRMKSDLAAGKAFDALAAKAVAAGSAKRVNISQFVPEAMVNPAVAAELVKIRPAGRRPSSRFRKDTP